MSNPKKITEFKWSEKKDTIQFINFGSEGEPFVVHIEDWTVYEMPPATKGWRPTNYILDIEGRGIRINSLGFQAELEQYVGKKASLTIRRFIPKDHEGKLLFSGTAYKVNQFNEASLWSYEDLSPDK